MPPKKVKYEPQPIVSTYTESIDLNRLKELIYSDLWSNLQPVTCSSLIAYTQSNQIKVTYSTVPDRPLGRIYSNGPSLQTLESKARSYLCRDSYVDIDIVNSHPTLLLYLYTRILKSSNTNSTKLLQAYIQNRDKSLKLGVIAAICGGNYEVCKLKSPELTLEFYNELKTIVNAINCNDGPIVINGVTVEATCDLYKRTGYYLEVLERSIIVQFEDLAVKAGLEIAANTHDGLIVYRHKEITKILKQANKTFTEYGVCFIIKPWPTDELIALYKLESSESSNSSTYRDLLDCHANSFNSLGDLDKKILPLIINSVRTFSEIPDAIWLKSDNSNRIRLESFSAMSKESSYFVYGSEPKKLKLYRDLIDDRYKKLIMCFNLKQYGFQRGYLTSWRGYKYESQSELDKELVNQVQKFLLVNICNNIQPIYEYLLNWLAFIIQNPGRQTQVAVVLTGSSGAGKSTLLTFLHNLVFGPMVTNKSNGLSCLVDKFNDNLEGKVLLTLEELESTNHENWSHTFSMVKDLLTNDVMTVEKKYSHKRVVENAINVIACTNNYSAVPARSDMARRFFIIEVNPTFKSDNHANREVNSKFWQEMTKLFAQQNTANHFGTFLEQRDLSEVNITLFPVTQIITNNSNKALTHIEKALLIAWIRHGRINCKVRSNEIRKIQSEYKLFGPKFDSNCTGLEMSIYIGKAELPAGRLYNLRETPSFQITAERLEFIESFMNDREEECQLDNLDKGEELVEV